MSEDITEVVVRTMTHRATGLKMAMSDDLHGFTVHAHSDEELAEKIPAALQSFIKHTRGEDSVWVLKELTPGFDPIQYRAITQKAA